MFTPKKIIPVSLKQNINWYFERKRRSAEYEQKEMNNPGDYKSMNCFHYYKCYFIHIPKTAGKSVSKTLFGNFSGGHTPAEKFLKHFGEYAFNHYYKFAFVRNPWDRLFSAYNYFHNGAVKYSREEKWQGEFLFYKENLSQLKNFEQFVMDWLDEEKLYKSAVHFLPQHYMLTLAKNRNKIVVNFVGKFEKLDEEFKVLCDKLRRPQLKLEKINMSENKKNSYLHAYSNDMIKKVGKLYAGDVELFQYSFAEESCNNIQDRTLKQV